MRAAPTTGNEEFDAFSAASRRKKNAEELADALQRPPEPTGAGARADAAAVAAPPAARRRRRTMSLFLVDGHGVQLGIVLCILVDLCAMVCALLVLSGVVPRRESVLMLFDKVPHLLSATLVVYVVEIMAHFFSKRMLMLLDWALVMDAALVAALAFAEGQQWHYVWRLLVALRLWRVARLVKSMLAVVRSVAEERAQTIVALRQELAREVEAAAEAKEMSRRESESRKRVEAMLSMYKEQVDTLREALAIAAQSVEELREQGGMDDAELAHALGGTVPPPRRRGGQQGSARTRVVIQDDGSVVAAGR